MTTYRFRVKLEADPRSLWRDIVIGGDRTVVEFQRTINAAVGLNQDHLWFFGTDQDYWNSDVQFKSPHESDDLLGGLRHGREYDAADTTIDDMAAHLGLEERDRICYLFDYGDEWRFYAILKDIDGDDPGDREPTIVKEKGDTVTQYRYP